MKLPKNKLKIKNLKLKTLLFLFFTFSILGFMFVKAHAQELQRTFTVINPQIAEKLDPGQKTEGTTKVINETNSSLTFSVSVQDYIVSDTKGTPQILPPNTLNSKYSATAWIGVSPSVFTLKPREKQTINYYIQVPKSAKPGGHYAALIYQPVNKDEGGKTGGTVYAQIGSLFYITINGPIKESATVTKFFANAFQEYGPIKILSQIKNMGDLHIMPKGTVTVSGLFFNKSENLPSSNIFPETARDFENTVGQNLMIGRYKAVLLASYGVNNNLPLTATLYFWVFPWRLAIVVILVIVAIILGLMYYKKRKEKTQKPTDKKTETTDTEQTQNNQEVIK